MNKVAIGVIFGALGVVVGGVGGYFIGMKKASGDGASKKSAKKENKPPRKRENLTFNEFKKRQEEEAAERAKEAKEAEEAARIKAEEDKKKAEAAARLVDEEDRDAYENTEEPRKPAQKTQIVEEGLKKNSKNPRIDNNYYKSHRDPTDGIYLIDKDEFEDEMKRYNEIIGTYYPDTNRLELYTDEPTEPLDGEAVEKAIGSIDLEEAFRHTNQIYIRNEGNGVDYDIDIADGPDPYADED